MRISIKEAIDKVVRKKSLTEKEASDVMELIMDGEATPAQISAFLVGLRMKGETVPEITGCARVMRQKVTKIKTPEGKIIVDTCGTGGDRSNTFNISTTAAFVVAGAGVPVAKHGNRSVSSRCGSADLLKEFGVKIDIKPEVMELCIKKTGIGFLFAPLLHKAMKYAIGPRSEMGIRTIFNILGPLSNPANADAQLLGVYDAKLTETLARVLKRLGVKTAFVVNGSDGLDEVTLTGKTRVSELRNGKVRTYNFNPVSYGFKLCSPGDLKGGNPADNARITIRILNGQKGSKRDVVVLNSAFTIIAGGKAEDLREGIKLAKRSIDSGEAMKRLNALKRCSGKF